MSFRRQFPGIPNRGRIVLLVAALLTSTGRSEVNAVEPPYPPSPVIAGFELDWSTHQQHAIGSDNWPMTWAEDDHQYAAWGDGGGFGGTNREGRVSLGVARVEGDADNVRGQNIWGGKNSEAPATFAGKSYGILSVDGVLYLWWVPDPLPHLRETRIAWSTDQGKTWRQTEWKFTFDDGLTIPTFLNYGKAYAGARDEYVYSYFIRPGYGPGQSTSPLAYQSGFDVHRPGAIYLSRVPRDRILDRDGYEFFAGLDPEGQPRWTAQVRDKQPVFEDPAGVGWNVSVGHHPGVGRYLLCTEHSRSHLGKLGIFDAPEPWGPWTTVAYEDAWGEGHIPVNTFYWSFPSKWMAAEETGFTFVFTGRTTNDSFNSVRGRFTLHKSEEKAEPSSSLTPSDESTKIVLQRESTPLTWPEDDLSQRMMDGAHRFIDRKLAATAAKRAELWEYVLSTPEAFVRSVDPHRGQLRVLLGVVEDRLPARMERYGDDRNPVMLAETEDYQVFQVRWPVFEGIFGEGLLVLQKSDAVGQVVVVPDADQVPEQLLGLAPGGDPETAIAKRLAANGFDVLIPAIVGRGPLQTTDPRIKRADYTPREWIYRQAFHMGRHIIGYEIQRVMAGVDWMETRREDRGPIGIVGYGEGGLIALHSAALDPRIDATVTSGYFNSSDSVWSEPIYRNVWSRLNRFGNAEVASMVLPRVLIIEHSPFPNVTEQKGEIHTPELTQVVAEHSRIPASDALPPPELIVGPKGQPVGPWSAATLNAFGLAFDITFDSDRESPSLADRRENAAERIVERQQRMMDQLEAHVQSLVRRSEQVREKAFLHQVMPEFAEGSWSTERRHPVHAAEKFIAGAKQFRKQFHEQAMGRFDDPLLPFNARTRVVAETEQWTAYDVVLDVYQDLFSWGVLVLPKDLKPGERRPVVVCQHGRNGLPRDTLDNHKTAYNDFAAKLAERGFITFAPHNLYRGEDRYRWLDRKANAVGCTLFSFIIAQHDQTLRWLDTLPFVDGDRIAFYGLSYGGETAVRVPTILEKYCLSICSGDFNQWTRKVASTEEPFSFMNTTEWEMPYWNLGHTFDYAEMAYLMAPRPFMVERGHHDRVGRDHWVAHEFAKVRWLYAQLGMSDRVEIEFFQGGHSINGEGTFDFLHKHLDWPKPAASHAGSKSR